jgi:hypothetical protein
MPGEPPRWRVRHAHDLPDQAGRPPLARHPALSTAKAAEAPSRERNRARSTHEVHMTSQLTPFLDRDRAGNERDRAIAEVEAHAAHNSHPLPVVLARGEGAWVEDVEGRRYLDRSRATARSASATDTLGWSPRPSAS